MNPTLHFLNDLKRDPVEVSRSVVLIGRHPECDVRIRNSSISRRHCCLIQVNDSLFVRDVGSLHGIWVNGKQVIEQQLHSGDELAIGPVFLKVGPLSMEESAKSNRNAKDADAFGFRDSSESADSMDGAKKTDSSVTDQVRNGNHFHQPSDDSEQELMTLGGVEELSDSVQNTPDKISDSADKPFLDLDL
ncbi:MAG: hypothetical protein RJA81_1479 [Planctomycetota bacterium]